MLSFSPCIPLPPSHSPPLSPLPQLPPGSEPCLSGVRESRGVCGSWRDSLLWVSEFKADMPDPDDVPNPALMHAPEPKSNPGPKLEPTVAPLSDSSPKPEPTPGPEISPAPAPRPSSSSRCCPRLSSPEGMSWPWLVLIREESLFCRESRGLAGNSSKSWESKICSEKIQWSEGPTTTTKMIFLLIIIQTETIIILYTNTL